MLGKNKPLQVLIHADPKSGTALEEARYVYVFNAGTSFPSGILHPVTQGENQAKLSESQGHIGAADKAVGAVFGIAHGSLDGKDYPYIENLTANKGWTPADILLAA